MKELGLQQRHEKATSKKGRERVLAILHAARDLIVSEGFSSFSMRKVAEKSGITVGNLSYYYSSKADLIHDLVESVLEGYQEDWQPFLEDERLSAEEKLIAFMTNIIEDLETKETTRFFPELWVMATHDEVIHEIMMNIYQKVRDIITALIKDINPELSDHSVESLALFISASIEGHTVFVGYNKGRASFLPNILNISLPTFIHAIKTLTNDQIQASK